MRSDREAAARLYRHARREALFVMANWTAALLWSIGYCYLFGYRHEPESWVVRVGLAQVRTAADLNYYAGLPDWVCFGIVVPWLVCTAVAMIFSLVGMRDDDLGVEAEEASHVGH